jgi:hypothetical protein
MSVEVRLIKRFNFQLTAEHGYEPELIVPRFNRQARENDAASLSIAERETALDRDLDIQ